MNTAIRQKNDLSKLRHSYNVVEENLYHPDLGEYRTYGIQIMNFDGTDILQDVSVCENTVNHIVNLLNRYQLSPIHLRSVVMDMLP